MDARRAALDTVNDLGWHVFRLRIEHDDAVCDGGTANCKRIKVIGGSWADQSSDDADEVAEWDWSRANAYGIDCGKSGILVVDQDPGADWPFNGTRVHGTGRGTHHIYTDMLGLGNRAHLEPWGVDVRGVGGMVIGPGSWHPHGGYELLDAAEPADPPADLLDAYRRQDHPSGPVDSLPASLARARLQGVYDRMRNAQPGERNHLLNVLAGTAAGLWVRIDEDDRIASLTEEAVRQSLTDAALQAGLGAAETDRTLESGWAYGLENPIQDLEEEDLVHQIFDATPVLQHIRTAAHSRMVGSGATLCYVLGRVLAEAPPSIVLPPGGGGDRASLNLAFALVGKSGDGKSSIAKVSQRLLGVDQAFMETGLGSGEGLIESFLEKVQIPKEGGGFKWEKRVVDPPHRILEIDEIARLDAVGKRDGSTIQSVLRSALTGGALKSSNATSERTRNVPGNSYRLIVFAGVQPELSGVLLNDVAAGTPQRYVWVSVIDRTQPDDPPAWPGELDWSGVHLEFAGEREVSYPDEVREYLTETRLKQVRGEIDPAHGHRALVRLKVACALAFLHGEIDVTDQWWRIAGRIIRWSVKEQERCRDALRTASEVQNIAKGRATAQMEMAKAEVFDDVEERARERVLEIIAAAGDEGVVGRDVMNGVSKEQRRYAKTILGALAEEGAVLAVKSGRGLRYTVGDK